MHKNIFGVLFRMKLPNRVGSKHGYHGYSVNQNKKGGLINPYFIITMHVQLVKFNIKAIASPPPPKKEKRNDGCAVQPIGTQQGGISCTIDKSVMPTKHDLLCDSTTLRGEET